MTRERRPLAAVALAAAALALGAAGCGGGGGPSAGTIVSRSAAATAKQRSFHLVVQISGVATSHTGMTLTSLDGNVAVPDRLRAHVGGSFQGIPLQSQLIVIGDAHYLQNPFTQAWQPISLHATPLAFFNPARGVLAVMRSAHDLRRHGSEQVGGVDCYRVTATVRADALTPLLGNPDSRRTLPVELWIGERDSLLRQVRLVGALASTDRSDATRTVQLSRFGERVSIAAPATKG